MWSKGYLCRGQRGALACARLLYSNYAFMLLLVYLLLGFLPAQESAPSISFRSVEQDFGELRAGRIVVLRFPFVNQGNAPLLIKDVYTGCGCTLATYPRRPIVPGDSAVISVKFHSAGRSGLQQNELRVISNSPQPETLLKISGKVLDN